MVARQNSIVPVERIQNCIVLVRGQKVILDRDLAALYRVETRVLNQSVQRNISRFPRDFMFELSRGEIKRISQFVISSDIKYSKRVRAFTEQGVAMLSSVLRSPRAVSVNIEIMRAFVKLRQVLATHADLARKLDELEEKYDAQFKFVFDAIRELMSPPQRRRKQIGFHVRERQATYRVRRNGPRPGR
ncbi:MAG TPA: ORF6N domain-containing protein [Verrucomicrobiae bacterium]|nr:ORF6N domain-containing protein [Verrucomicrobiae bacterium]